MLMMTLIRWLLLVLEKETSCPEHDVTNQYGDWFYVPEVRDIDGAGLTGAYYGDAM